MGEALWCVLGSLCTAVAVIKVIGCAWCLFELRRKWCTVPELWGIDWLDVVFRLKREFAIAITAADFEGLSADARISLTAGQLWEMIAAKLRVAKVDPPPDGWQRVVMALSEALNVQPKQIRPDSRL